MSTLYPTITIDQWSLEDDADDFVAGFPYSFGIFQDYYITSPDFRDSDGFAVIGTCAMV